MSARMKECWNEILKADMKVFVHLEWKPEVSIVWRLAVLRRRTTMRREALSRCSGINSMQQKGIGMIYR